MLLISSIPQSTTAQIDRNVWLNDRGNVEMTSEAAIDRSKILSDWVRLRDTLKVREDQLRLKDSLINALALTVAEKTGELKAVNEYIAEQTDKVEEISDKQLDIATRGLWNILDLRIQALGNLTEYVVPDNQSVRDKAFEHWVGEAVININIGRFYIVGTGAIGSDNFEEVRAGIGINVF